MTHTIIEADINVVKVAQNVRGSRSCQKNTVVATPSMSARSIGPALKQPTFNSKAQGRYGELLNFEMEVKNIFKIKSYDICNSVRVLIIMKWLGDEGLHFV